MTTATKTLAIHHSNGNQTRYADTMRDAIRILKSQYGQDVVVNDDWDELGVGRERKLVWANEEDADNDAGQNAVAEIIRSA